MPGLDDARAGFLEVLRKRLIETPITEQEAFFLRFSVFSPFWRPRRAYRFINIGSVESPDQNGEIIFHREYDLEDS